MGQSQLAKPPGMLFLWNSHQKASTMHHLIAGRERRKTGEKSPAWAGSRYWGQRWDEDVWTPSAVGSTRQGHLVLGASGPQFPWGSAALQGASNPCSPKGEEAMTMQSVSGQQRRQREWGWRGEQNVGDSLDS